MVNGDVHIILKTIVGHHNEIVKCTGAWNMIGQKKREVGEI